MVMMIGVVLVAGLAVADGPYNQYSDVPSGTQPGASNPGVSHEGGTLRSLTFYNDRATFDAAFPGLPTEDWSNTLVAPAAIEACPGPFNSATNNTCFAPGGILDGIELDFVPDPTSTFQLVVIGAGALGNTAVLAGPNTFADDMVFNFNPAVRAVGLDLVNPLNPGAGTYTVEIFGPAGSLGTTTVSDGPEGNFWGVDSDDVGGITSIVFGGGGIGDNAELSTLITFGGEPVPVELQSFEIE
jgi:hypothetical protein